MDEFAVKILAGLIRAGLAAFGGWMLQQGWVDSAWVNDLVGFSAIAAAAAWSWVSKVWAEEKLDKAVAAPAGMAE